MQSSRNENNFCTIDSTFFLLLLLALTDTCDANRFLLVCYCCCCCCCRICKQILANGFPYGRFHATLRFATKTKQKIVERGKGKGLQSATISLLSLRSIMFYLDLLKFNAVFRFLPTSLLPLPYHAQFVIKYLVF